MCLKLDNLTFCCIPSRKFVDHYMKQIHCKGLTNFIGVKICNLIEKFKVLPCCSEISMSKSELEQILKIQQTQLMDSILDDDVKSFIKANFDPLEIP